VCAKYSEWDEIYRKNPLDTLGWELGRPRPVLVEYIEKGAIPKGKALDLCCGAGTNTIYLAEKGFDVVGVDVSPTAVEYAQAQAAQAHISVAFSVESFLDLSFESGDIRFCF
jgi:2-polyprenyl-3-methyl-5-hydroxy-6-metoxy-1,4-benzoquinol methylase